jgi:cobalt-zinc-cadmium efflux system outer membrane protein
MQTPTVEGGIVPRKILLLSGVLVLLGGCRWPVRELTDQTVTDFIEHPFDVSPEKTARKRSPEAEAKERTALRASPQQKQKPKEATVPEVPTDVMTTAWMDSPRGQKGQTLPGMDEFTRTVAQTSSQAAKTRTGTAQPKRDSSVVRTAASDTTNATGARAADRAASASIARAPEGPVAERKTTHGRGSDRGASGAGPAGGLPPRRVERLELRAPATAENADPPVPAGPSRRLAATLPKLDLVVARTSARPGSQPERSAADDSQPKLQLQIPKDLPGSEAPPIAIPLEPTAAERALGRLYPELPPLPTEPQVLPGPDGKPYTLADFQRLAAAHSPTLRQAASDVEAAKGLLIQAKTYPNPIASYLVDPSNNNSTAGVQGGALEQIIITGGKMKLGVAAAQKNLDNAILALKRARSDLSTAVRNAYFTVLVDVETLIVTRAQARLADDIFRLQVGLQKGTQAAAYEPTALRAQAFTNRLAYRQAIASYIYDWKALVAAVGMEQLPLSEVAGRVDRLIPYYDYDEALAHVLQNHTDMLTAKNGVKIAQYGLKLAQVTPVFPNLDVRWSLEKDFALGPFGTYQTLALGVPLPVWDQNKGNIIAAQAALVRASEESHRVQVTLTNGLALAYEGYRNNLYAMDYYRRSILPDLVNYYRGVFERRQIDPNASFGDLVFAQQNLSTNITAYIGILGSLWTSVVGVADYLQTDDLFQLARPHELAEVPDLSKLPACWECGHSSVCRTPSGLSDPAVPGPPRGSQAAPPASADPARPAVAEPGAQPAPAREGQAPPGPPPNADPPPGQPPASDAGAEPAPVPAPRPLGAIPGRVPPPRSGSVVGQSAAKATVRKEVNRTPQTSPAAAAPVTIYSGKGENHDGQDS